MNYTTNRITRLTGFVLALVIATVINAALLWKFDRIAQEATLAHSNQSSVDLSLDPVTIVAPGS